MLSQPPSRGFSNHEFLNRTQALQHKMANQHIDGILVMSEPEIRYFTGFQTLFWQSPTRPWFVFIPADGKPIAIIPDIGRDLMQHSWLDDIRTWSAPCPSDDGISLILDILSPLHIKKQTLGIMKGHETSLRMPLGDWEHITQQLPNLNIVDCTPIIQHLRMVKSPHEIEKLSHICALGSATFDEITSYIKEGVPLADIFRQFRISALQLGVDDAPYVVGGADKHGYKDVISPPSQKPLQQGDVMMIDTGCVWDGYYCDFDRNWAIGYADDASKHAYDVLWRATQAGIEAARPGNSCHDLHAAMANIIKEIDDSGGDIGRFGHGLGMQLTEQPSNADFDHTIIEENMVLTLEPSLSYNDGRIMVHEENIVVGANKTSFLTKRAAPTLPIL